MGFSKKLWNEEQGNIEGYCNLLKDFPFFEYTNTDKFTYDDMEGKLIPMACFKCKKLYFETPLNHK